MQVTSNNPTIAVSINHDNYTNKVIKETKKFGLSILKYNSDSKIIGEFGFKSSRDTDKFEDASYEEMNGIPVITDSCGKMVCEVIDMMETGTHTVFLGKVIEADGYTNDNPMTYRYYHEKLKGTSPKNAPTYEEEKEVKQENRVKTKKWKCKICGYVYEGESVPEDFICPICGQPHTEFYLVED